MRFIKRFMAVILTISLFAVSVAGCASSKEQASDMLTREEWIAMLMEAYHMDECYNTTPVFADVSTQSEYFVQTPNGRLLAKPAVSIRNLRLPICLQLLQLYGLLGLIKLKKQKMHRV